MGRFKIHEVSFYKPQPEAIHCMTSLDNDKLALSRSSGQIEIWSYRSKSLFQEKIIPPEFGHSIESLVSCKGRLFSAGLNGIILEYDLVNLKVKNATSTLFGACWCMAVNEAGTHLAVGTEDGYILLFELSENSLTHCRSLDKQEGRIMCLSWHASGDFIATGSLGSVRFWDVRVGHTLQKINVKRSNNRKDVIVWCIKLNRDFEIFCGDSTGQVSVIDARKGVLVDTIHSLTADVLCLAYDEGKCIFYASGIDPTIVRFERINTDGETRWSKTFPMHHHSHDVRALVFVNDCLFSGGVDADVVMSTWSYKTHAVKFPPFAHKPCVHVAKQANLILLQYPTSLELWRLGTTSEDSKIDRKSLTLSSDRLKLIEIKARENEVIVCSTVSDDGQWVSYSTNRRLRMFQVQLELAEADVPHVTLHRVRFLPKQCSPSLSLKFSPDASRCYSLMPIGDVQVLGIDPIKISFLHKIESDSPSHGSHLLSMSWTGKYIAVGSHSGEVFVYDTNEFKKHCKLPKMEMQPTAMTFLPKDEEMVVAYESGKVVGYDLLTKMYSRWCPNLHVTGARRQSETPVTIRGITCCPKKPNVVLCHSLTRIFFLEKENKNNKDKFKNRDVYKFLLDFEYVNAYFMVAVEVPPTTLTHQLPPQLKKRKFRR